MFDVLAGLNEAQLEAVTTTEGYIRVIAGAGSGKTRALTHRYAYLVNELGISTSNILCVTFTNKAANEMKKRIRTMIGDNDTGYVSTFHGFCVQLLREDIHTINFPQNFVVLDTEDTETILKQVYEAAGIQSKDYTFEMARRYISKEKCTSMMHMPYFLEMDINVLHEKFMQESDKKKKILLGYLYEQRKCYGLDYDDLITVALYILENFEEKCRKWQERMMYVMVDEFQDVSGNQYALADILSEYHQNLFIVGDPDQTIYSWRYADVNHILNFDVFHEGTRTIFLNQNYRSTPNILNASNSLIRNNKRRIEKELVATRPEASTVLYHHAKTTGLEAEWVAGKIKELLEAGRKYSDVTILYRSHYVSRSIEEKFVQEKIPYVLYSGVEFYKRKEIKDILSYLRMLVQGDDLSFQRVVNEPRRNFGKKRMTFIKEYAQRKGCTLYQALQENLQEPLIAGTKAGEFVKLIERFRMNYQKLRLAELLTQILNESGYEAMLRLAGEQERLDNLSELKQSVFEFEKTSGEDNTLEEYLQKVALFTNVDKDERKESVKMMTIHTAKGLEFPYVFVCGLSEGIFPTKHVDTQEKLEEERRLAYVAYTRAENGLFLSDAEGTNYDGSYRFPSRFLFNTDKAYVQYTTELDSALIEAANCYIKASEEKMHQEANTFQPGDMVRHKVFGIGTILEVKEELSCYTIKFESTATPRNIAMRVPLEAVKQTS